MKITIKKAIKKGKRGKKKGSKEQELLRKQLMAKLMDINFELMEIRETMDDLPGMLDAQKHVQATIALIHNADVSLWKNGVPWG